MRLPRLRATEASGDSWDDPDDDKLAALILGLDPENRFVIVERHDRPSLWQYYMQVYLDDDGTYAIEFREGGPDSHFRAIVPANAIAADTLVQWAGDDPRWREALKWQRWEPTPD